MKKSLIIFLGIVISHCAVAQGLTKNGHITTAGATYVSKNGAIGTPTGVNTNGKLVAAVTLHVLGESYQGGIIFYILQSGDPGYNPSVQHGFIVAPTDQSSGAVWGCDNIRIAAAENDALGAGKANTAAIIAGSTGCSSQTAAQMCANLTIGGFTDWYLPSVGELTQLDNLRSNESDQSILNLLPGNYWSSSEANLSAQFGTSDANAYGFGFGSGFSEKQSLYSIRAIRSF